jgi:RNA polymerase sigma-70 factor, ECF subfamily
VQKVPALGSDVLIAVSEVFLPDEVPQKSSDTELLRLARKGDSRAFRILVRRHDRYLYRVARSVLLNDQEAEDVVQETFIRAFTRLVGFRGESRLSTWLTRIALNESRRRKRSHRHQLGLEVLDSSSGQRDAQIHDSFIYPVQDPARATAQDQIRMVLERAIDGLPDAFRTVFVRMVQRHADRGDRSLWLFR